MMKVTNNKTGEHICELCQRAIANKTNSHIVPSFLVCKTTSSDGSGKRNHEIIFSVGKTTRAYTGNEVPRKIFDRNFDNITDERINEELKINTLSRDYVFCSSCEKNLGDYLESPYASRKNIDANTSYYFWLSILWRVNCFKLFRTQMPKFILSELRKSLNYYLQARENNHTVYNIKPPYPFSYRILTCKDYSIGCGCIYAEYDKSNCIYSLALGGLIICFCFRAGSLPDNYVFLGIEDELKQAPSNDGTEIEKTKNVSKEKFDKAYYNVQYKTQANNVANQVKWVYRLWNELIKQHYMMPSPTPPVFFIQHCLKVINDNQKKIGEIYTERNYAISFGVALKETYGLQVSCDGVMGTGE